MKLCSYLFAISVVATSATTLTSCNPEPDESDLFTATGETAIDYIKRKSELTSFTYILNRVGLDRNLSSYGEYTCYAPTNDAITVYIDSLYNDTEAPVEHNGMTENSLEGLSDSLCSDIARYHLANGTYSTIEMGGGGMTVNTMLGRNITTEGSTDSIGRVTLNGVSVIIQPDSVVTNGIVHVVNRVVPRTTRVIPDMMERIDEFKIFTEALILTGLADSLKKFKKNVEYPDPTTYDHNDTNGDVLFAPTECKIGYTVFVEPDAVMQQNGINNIDDLIKYANDVYGNAASWYTYPSEKGISISTGDDYTNRFNALNMFVAYHILYAGMPENQLVYEWGNGKDGSNDYWNYVNGAQPYDYYETMLPGTLLKIWQPGGAIKSNGVNAKALYINRYITFNTLTDELGTMGSEGMHQVVRQGIRINRTIENTGIPTNQAAFNGYVHSIRGMLVYDEQVPKGVLHERMRFDTTTFLPEFINNDFRMSNATTVKGWNGGGSGSRIAFPQFSNGTTYFDNVVSYTTENRLRYNVVGAYNAWQSNTFQGWGNYDLAVKMPPLPTNTYEFRIFYTPMSHGGMMQFYMGSSSKQSDMVALDIPLDVRLLIDDPRIGWTNYNEEEDMGVSTDAALRNRGYMRGLYSYADHAERADVGAGSIGDNKERNQRYTSTGNNSLRKIMGRMTIKQSEERWFRIKNVIPDETDLKWQLDYVEFVPVDVVDNDTYTEDWY
ncbi:MAG: fasciclin domain-containing protein [Prevotella sp.]|nr:fasciclin domain-containing protein [Prevotella sp.]